MNFTSIAGNIQFPRDQGNHGSYGQEWWYLLGTFTEADESGKAVPGGRQYGALVNVVRFALICLEDELDMSVSLMVLQ